MRCITQLSHGAEQAAKEQATQEKEMQRLREQTAKEVGAARLEAEASQEKERILREENRRLTEVISTKTVCLPRPLRLWRAESLPKSFAHTLFFLETLH